MLNNLLRWFKGPMTPKQFATRIFIGVAVAWVVWLLVLVRLARWVAGDDVDKLGQTGDLFGGINALFAAFAFAGVAVAAYYQHLSWQLLSKQSFREEARHARENFQPLFFQLLTHLPKFPDSLHRAPSMSHNDATMVKAGAHPLYVASEIVEALRTQILMSHAYNAVLLGEEDRLPDVLRRYDELYESNESSLGPYLRSLYHVFKLINTSDLDEPSRVQYANIARARLDVDVLFLLTLNCATKRGAEFRPLVERYGLLKHLRWSTDPETSKSIPEQMIANWCFSPTAVMNSSERDEYWAKNPVKDPRMELAIR